MTHQTISKHILNGFSCFKRIGSTVMQLDCVKLLWTWWATPWNSLILERCVFFPCVCVCVCVWVGLYAWGFVNVWVRECKSVSLILSHIQIVRVLLLNCALSCQQQPRIIFCACDYYWHLFRWFYEFILRILAIRTRVRITHAKTDRRKMNRTKVTVVKWRLKYKTPVLAFRWRSKSICLNHSSRVRKDLTHNYSHSHSCSHHVQSQSCPQSHIRK